MAFTSPETCSCRLLANIENQSVWMLDYPSWVLAVQGSRMWGNVVSVYPSVLWVDSLFSVVDRSYFFCLVEDWLLLFWSEAVDIGRWRTMIFPSFGWRTPSCFMIFMRRLQKERHIRAAFFTIVWKIWAQMSIGAPVMRSHKNCALLRLMNPMLESGYKLEKHDEREHF